MISISAFPSITAPETLLSITTPSVQPSECDTYWYLISVSVASHTPPSTVTVLVSDPADRCFASCQPSGWDRAATENRFSFSPAACPTNWVYINMVCDVSVNEQSSMARFSTAHCCASEYDIWAGTEFPVSSMSHPCYRTISDGATSIMETLSHGEGSTVLFTDGIQAHEKWHITWEDADRSTLTPSLPDLTSGKYIPEWTPGEVIPPGKYDMEHEQGSDMPGAQRVINFAMIGAPTLGVAVIAPCIWLCVRHGKKKKKKKRLEMEGSVGRSS